MSPTRGTHRHTLPGQHEHDFEPQHGLPELLPRGEQLLWQGSPDWRTLAIRRFHVRKLVIYFAALLGARVVSGLSDQAPLLDVLKGAVPMLALSLVALGLVTLIAWLTASTTVYTLTDKRVVMRIGVVLTLTLNLPLRRMGAAALDAFADGHGDIALQLQAPDRVAFLHLWPHARRWRFARPEPTLLAVPDAAAVAQQLTQAWRAATQSTAPVVAPAATTATPPQRGLAPQAAAPAVSPTASAPTLAIR